MCFYPAYHSLRVILESVFCFPHVWKIPRYSFFICFMCCLSPSVVLQLCIYLDFCGDLCASYTFIYFVFLLVFEYYLIDMSSNSFILISSYFLSGGGERMSWTCRQLLKDGASIYSPSTCDSYGWPGLNPGPRRSSTEMTKIKLPWIKAEYPIGTPIWSASNLICILTTKPDAHPSTYF